MAKRTLDPHHVSAGEAMVALEDNARTLTLDKDRALWNLNVALLYVVSELKRISHDLEILHNRTR